MDGGEMNRKQETELMNALQVDVEKIDHLIAAGYYTSRADFLRSAVAMLLAEHRCTHADMSAAMSKLLMIRSEA
jgi:Arc/MetJ-type ribon-helix-helix transcriptional regulator